MNWWQALILGVIEGVTEYLPVSSTGHLILTEWLLGLDRTPDLKAAADTYTIVIQAGAILAVLGLYRGRIRQMLSGLVGRDEAGLRLALRLVIAFLPAAALGPLLADDIERYLFRPWPVAGALFVGAWLMLAVAYSRRLSHSEHSGHDLSEVTIPMSLLIGFGQCIAMWPGTSRSMMTIVTALMLGLRPRAAAEFSFLLGLITLTAATGYKVVFDGAQMMRHFDWPVVALGVGAATVSAIIAVRWFVAVLVRYGMAPFAWYRLALAAIVVACIIKAGLSFQL